MQRDKYVPKKVTMFLGGPRLQAQSILDFRQGDASARADVKQFPHHITHLECKLAGIQVTLMHDGCLHGRICTYPISLEESTVN